MIDANNSLTQPPQGWVWTRLLEISEIILGQSPPSSTYNDEGNGLPFYQGKLEFGDVYPIARKWCSSPKKIAEKGDILISVRAPVGPTNICPDKSCIGRGLAAIRPFDGIESHFILYLLRAFENVLAGKGTGTTFNAITGDQLRTFSIALPPLLEQRRIVAKIEELFTRLDAGVDALNKIKLQLKQYRQAVLKHAFEGKLTEEWREAYKAEMKPVPVLLERIKEERKKNVKGKLKELPRMDTSGLPELPEGWVWTRLGDIAQVITGNTPSKKDPENYGKDIPFAKPPELNDCVITSSEDNLSQKGAAIARVLPPDAVLVSCIGILGKTGINKVTVAFNQQINAAVFYEGVLPKYGFYYSQTLRNWLYGVASATTLPIVNKSRFELAPVPLAPLPEQHKIVEEIDRCFSVADAIEKDVGQSIKQGDRLRQAILKRAFVGKVVPQDPNDEPAEKLLERVMAEKAKSEVEKKARGRGRSKLKTIEGRLI
ncbi:Type-1 restriction enzyme EcoKI specificity protein [subsurface metagenome]